jgi:S-adenosylmethionine:tRNA ribosyltransferase-isomerase
VRVDLLDYQLPAELIAQRPPVARDGGRMLVVDPVGADEVILEDRTVAELAEMLPAGALLVVNDTRVLPARLFARKRETGGRVEIFLVRREGPGSYSREVEGEAPVVIEGEVWRALG